MKKKVMKKRLKGEAGGLFKKAEREERLFKQWIEDRFNWILKNYLLIDHVKLHFEFEETDAPSENGRGTTVFESIPNVCYHRMLIVIFPVAYKLWKKQRVDLLEGMVHELCHYHTSDLSDICEKRFTSKSEIRSANEDLTETISKYILKNILHEHKVDALVEDKLIN